MDLMGCREISHLEWRRIAWISGAGGERALEEGLQPALLRARDRGRRAQRGECGAEAGAQRGAPGGASAAAGAAVDVHRPARQALCAPRERPDDAHAGRCERREASAPVRGTPMTPKPSQGPLEWPGDVN